MEHRCGQRRGVSFEVWVSTRGGVTGSGCLVEASGSGARLVTRLPVSVGSIVTLSFEGMRTPDLERLRLEARVVRRTADGYGVGWMLFAPAGLRTIFRTTESLSRSRGRYGGWLEGMM
jgi:hypothetical protein